MTVPWLVSIATAKGTKRGLLAPLLPAGLGMLKAELGHDLAGGIKDDGVVVLLGPIETDEVSEGGGRGRHGDFPVRGSGGGLRSLCLGLSPEST
jgi:hypothetical protein